MKKETKNIYVSKKFRKLNIFRKLKIYRQFNLKNFRKLKIIFRNFLNKKKNSKIFKVLVGYIGR